MRTLPYEQRKRYHVLLLHIIDEYIRQYAKDFCLSDAIVKEIEQKSLTRSNGKFQHEIDLVAENICDVGYPVM